MEALIRKLESFGPLSTEDEALLRRVPVNKRTFGSRADVILEGDNPSDVHLIESGFACRYKSIEAGKRQIVAYLLPGDFCDLHVCILKAMDHSIATISPCEIIDIPRASVLQLLERGSLSRLLLMATLVDEATLREWITNVGQRPGEQRIAHLFCEIHARMQVVGLTAGGAFDLPVTQLELGEMVGLSTVHINRSLQNLRDDGLITFKNGRLRITDIGRLERMSGFRSNYLHLARDEMRQSVG